MYIGMSDTLILRRSCILASKSEGHEVKSRARRTVLEDNIIASLDGEDSRLIDIPNGGEIVIRRNVLEQGPPSVNEELIGIGLEGIKYENNPVLIEDNVIIADHARAVLMRSRVPVTFRNNTVIGGLPAPEGAPWRKVVPAFIRGQVAREGMLTGSDNVWHPDRAAAGLPPYPALPPSPADDARR